ncbi:MAG: GtrA family protein [Clostridia bacterium]|nr:GtrA family protein [Clostridia bacterium]
MSKKTYLETLIKQAFKFGIVGILNTGLTWIVYKVCRLVLNISLDPANFIGYFIGTLNSYILNKKWTFKSKGNIKRESVVFFGIAAICYAMQHGMLKYLHEYLNIHEDIAMILSMVFYTIINFLAHKFVTFREGGKK